MQRLFPASVKNLRDLGGIRTRAGNVVNEEDKLVLLEKGIDTVFDLRSSEELQKRKSSLNDPRFRYFSLPMKGDIAPNAESQVPEGYLEILDTVAGAPGGVLYHCHAGKDRSLEEYFDYLGLDPKTTNRIRFKLVGRSA